MINTTCQWCKRSIEVNWTPLTNKAMKTKPMVCDMCRLQYEAGWFRRLVKIRLASKQKI